MIGIAIQANFDATLNVAFHSNSFLLCLDIQQPYARTPATQELPPTLSSQEQRGQDASHPLLCDGKSNSSEKYYNI